MKVKLMITGGLGYIGSFTAKKFLDQNKLKPIVVDNLSRGNLFAKKYSKSKKLNISSLKVKKIIIKNKINTILHLAAFTCVRESIKNKKKYFNNNYKSQIKFIRNLKDTKVKYFIFSSSLSVFDKNKFKFNSSPYSKYKLKIEKYLKKIASSDFKVIILRYPNIVGSDPQGNLGEKNKFITRIVSSFYQNILNNKKNILFYDNKKKEFPMRSYMHVNDIANLNLKVIYNYLKFKKNFYVFNVFKKKYHSNYQVIKALSEVLKIEPKYVLKQISHKESIVPVYKKGDDIFKFLNFQPKYKNLKKILKTNIKWFKKIY